LDQYLISDLDKNLIAIINPHTERIAPSTKGAPGKFVINWD